GRTGRRRGVPGLPRRRQHGLLHPDPDRPPLPRQPEGRPLRRLPGLGAVDRVAPGGTAEGVVKDGDVLLSVEGYPIADDGTIKLGDARVTYEHAIDMLQVGDRAHFTVWRGGKELKVEAPARRIARYDRNRNRYGIAPDYVVYAGLVFMKLEVELLK